MLGCYGVDYDGVVVFCYVFQGCYIGQVNKVFRGCYVQFYYWDQVMIVGEWVCFVVMFGQDCNCFVYG